MSLPTLLQATPCLLATCLCVLLRVKLVVLSLRHLYLSRTPETSAQFPAMAHSMTVIELQLAELLALLGLLSCVYVAQEAKAARNPITHATAVLVIVHLIYKLSFALTCFFAPSLITTQVLRAQHHQLARFVLVMALLAELLMFVFHACFLALYLDNVIVLGLVLVGATSLHKYTSRALLRIGVRIMQTDKKNKLQANLETKGENAYYFAHQVPTSNRPLIVHDGLPQPILSDNNSTSKRLAKYQPVDSYSFSDCGAFVHVDFDPTTAFLLPSPSDVMQEHVLLFSPTSVSVMVAKTSRHFLSPQLFSTIAKAEFSATSRGNKLRLKLYKEKPGEQLWTSLEG
jgi:hypothetical protein